MNLSPEVAHLLRQALNEARAERDTDEAYYILAYALDNLLEPDDDCYCGSPKSDHRLGRTEHSYQRRPQADDPAPAVSEYDGGDLPW